MMTDCSYHGDRLKQARNSIVEGSRTFKRLGHLDVIEGAPNAKD